LRNHGIPYFEPNCAGEQVETNKESAKEPRWLALIAVLATGLVYAALPSSLSIGPRWLLLAVMATVTVSARISHRFGHHTTDKVIGYAASGILTIAMIWSLGLLVEAIPKHQIDPKILLRSAASLWAHKCSRVRTVVLAARRRWSA
jgi:hypothetical protein